MLSVKCRSISLFIFVISIFLYHQLIAQKKNYSHNIRKVSFLSLSNNRSSSLLDKKKEKKIREKQPYPSARTAALWSGLLPGAGQIYNQSYWKAPIVWGVIGLLGYFVVDNYIWYKKTGFAYKAKQLQELGDPSLLPEVDPTLLPLSTSSVRNYRNQFRNDIDLSGLFFLLGWGLNIVEAAVHAHLKHFDVSPSLTLNAYPYFNTNSYGLGLSLNIHTPIKHYKSIYH